MIADAAILASLLELDFSTINEDYRTSPLLTHSFGFPEGYVKHSFCCVRWCGCTTLSVLMNVAWCLSSCHRCSCCLKSNFWTSFKKYKAPQVFTPVDSWSSSTSSQVLCPTRVILLLSALFLFFFFVVFQVPVHSRVCCVVLDFSPPLCRMMYEPSPDTY